MARRAAAFVSRRLDRRIAVGEQAARLAEQALNLPAHSVGTIYNGLPNGPDRLVRPPSTEMVAGTLARLDRIKGLDVLLDAIAALDVRLVIAGEGPERGALERQAAALGERDRVQFVGWRDDSRAFLDGIDVFVLPSRNEGFPLSIIEAMFAGRPVVATRVGSVDEAVVDQETGLLVPADDVDALRSAIVTLADDPDRRDLMGTNGRQRALEHFSISKMASSFDALYDDLCSS
jgi:glycosyltransferase involved in cell wall biosynthesis